MTISSTVSRNNYVGNGATAVYPYTFRILDKSHLAVTKRDTSNIETTLAVDVGYTVMGIGEAAGGSITLTAGNLPSNYVLTIRRVVPLKQETDLRNQGEFFAETHEDAYDYARMVDQQQQDAIERALKLPETEAGSSVATVLPAISSRASKFLAFDSSGNPIAASSGITGVPAEASAINFIQSGTGAGTRDVQGKLREVVSVKDFGAVGDGTTDDTAAFTSALGTGKSVYVSDGTYKLTAALPLSTAGQELIGAGRHRTKLLISGDINGIILHRHNRLAHLRVMGNAAQAVGKACVLLGEAGVMDSARSRIHDCIIGGQATALGDASDIRTAAYGIKGANTFLNTISDCYVLKAEIGYYNKTGAGIANNALLFSGTEFHLCKVGALLSVMNGVTFDTCTFEGNDECGAIVGSSRAGAFRSCYFEGNHATAGATLCTDSGATPRKADLLIIADTTITNTTDPSGSISVKDCYVAKGTNSAYGIYVDNQRFMNIGGIFFTGAWTAGQGLFIGSNTNNSGRIYDFFGGATLLTNNAASVQQGPFEYTGNVNYKGGIKLGGLVGAIQSLSGTTANLAGTAPGPAGSEDLFTPNAGTNWLLFVKGSTNNSAIRWIGWIQTHAAAALTITQTDGASITIDNNAGAVRITNAGGSSATYNWAALRIL